MNQGTLSTFAALSTTPQVTYTDSTGGVANSTTITLNVRGETPNEVWLTAGQTYKFVLKDSSGSTVWTVDGVSGVNDVTGSFDEWKAGPAPTFVSATSFTLVGDQTQIFTIGRRVKTTNSGGTVYSIITASVFGALTTVTVVNDSGTLDSGLSAVSYGLLASTNESAPPKTDAYPIAQNNTDRTKRLSLSLSGLTTATKRTGTVPDSDFNLGMPRSYLAGLTMSTAGGSATMTVAAGAARDSTNAADLTLAAAISKTTSAWAVGSGNGGIDTGAIANGTWYHFYEIMRPDTGVVDVLFSLSASAPTMPANYTYKRRIGSGLTSGAAQWIAFIQDGDLFQLLVPVLETTSVNPGTNAVTQTLANVPTGVNVQALITLMSTGGYVTYASDLATTDAAPSGSVAPLGQMGVAAGGAQGWQGTVRTNTSGQIRTRISVSGAGQQLFIVTNGWIDRRGRDS